MILAQMDSAKIVYKEFQIDFHLMLDLRITILTKNCTQRMMMFYLMQKKYLFLMRRYWKVNLLISTCLTKVRGTLIQVLALILHHPFKCRHKSQNQESIQINMVQFQLVHQNIAVFSLFHKQLKLITYCLLMKIRIH